MQKCKLWQTVDCVVGDHAGRLNYVGRCGIGGNGQEIAKLLIISHKSSNFKNFSEQFFPNPDNPIQTECSATLFEFEAVELRAVIASFDCGDITSNAEALLLKQVDRGLGLIRRFAGCFTDRRDARYVEHRVETLVRQRIFNLVLSYENLNDHYELRKDPTFYVLTDKLHPCCG